MLCIYVALALASSSVMNVAEYVDPSLFLCDLTIEGSVCYSTGVAVYFSSGNPPPRPRNFYTISHTQWTFVGDDLESQMGFSYEEMPNVSGKFSCVFRPYYSGAYIFKLVIAHRIVDGNCKFSLTENPGIIVIDLNWSGTGTSYDLECTTRKNSQCTSNYDTHTEYYYCERRYDIVRMNEYPFFAGITNDWALEYEDYLWLQVKYDDAKGYTNLLCTWQDDCYLGLLNYTQMPTGTIPEDVSASASPEPSASASPRPSASASPKPSASASPESNSSVDSDASKTRVLKQPIVIGGICAGAIVLIVIVSTVLYIVLRDNGSGNSESMSRFSSNSKYAGGRKDSRTTSRSSSRPTSRGSSHYSSRGSARFSSGSVSNHRYSSRESSRASSRGSSRPTSRGSSHYSSRGSARYDSGSVPRSRR